MLRVAICLKSATPDSVVPLSQLNGGTVARKAARAPET